MADPTTNGHVTTPDAPLMREGVEGVLTGAPLSQGYRPTLPYWALWATDSVPQLYLLRDIELMLTHPVVVAVLNYFKGGIYDAEFWGGPAPDNNPMGLPVSQSPEVTAFVTEQCHRFWDRGLPYLQGGYEYGWIGLENLFTTENGPLEWNGLVQFSPRDTFLLTQDSIPVGVRVKNVYKKGKVDLFMASRDVPAKGLWYAHMPRYHSYYGQSQLQGAWRPWRRLAWKDGTETVIDQGTYRLAFAGPIVRYPEDDFQVAQPGVPATTPDSQGHARKYGRDFARQLGEWVKSGAAIGLSSAKYPPDMGGDFKWDVQWPQHVLDMQPIINAAKYLQDQICYGIGVPPELLQAAETGSGFSGRKIPVEAFISRQQFLADAILWLFDNQVLRPLVRWNFGVEARYSVKVKPLLQTKLAEKGGQQQQTSGAEGGSNMPAENRDVNWQQVTDDKGEAIWQSTGGLRRRGPAPPGTGSDVGQPVGGQFSLDAATTARIREVAKRILEAA